MAALDEWKWRLVSEKGENRQLKRVILGLLVVIL